MSITGLLPLPTIQIFLSDVQANLESLVVVVVLEIMMIVFGGNLNSELAAAKSLLFYCIHLLVQSFINPLADPPAKDAGIET